MRKKWRPPSNSPQLSAIDVRVITPPLRFLTSRVAGITAVMTDAQMTDASAAEDLPTDVLSLLTDHLPIIDAVCVAATCVAWREAMERGALSAFGTVSGSAAPLPQTPVLDKVGVVKESWAALLLMSRLVHARANSITSCDPIPHEPAASSIASVAAAAERGSARSEPGSMAARDFRIVLRQHLAHPATLSQVIKKLGSMFGTQMLGKGMCMSFAQRLVSEVGEPCSRCTQPLDRKTTLAYWIEFFIEFLNASNRIHSTADLLERTDYFLGYFLVREWDEEELHRMISKMEDNKMIIESGRATNDEDDWGDEEEEEYDDEENYSEPSPRAIGEAMHDCARAVFIVLSAIVASLNIFMDAETILRDEPLREALAVK